MGAPGLGGAPPPATSTDVLVIGGGPAGLVAAIELRRQGVGRVVVVERERDGGGIARHSQHTGYGWRDLHRVMTGPAYAATSVRRAEHAGVSLRTNTTAARWLGDRELELVAPSGVERISATAVVLATGTRERSRAARLVPGTRPLGVMTTGTLQQLVAFQRAIVGSRAVVVGAEHVSFSAVLTLAHGGCRTAAMVTALPRHQTAAVVRAVVAGVRGVPIHTDVTVEEIYGRARVEGVRLSDDTEIVCDTIVFTGDWIPDHVLARQAGLTIDAGTRGPAVDATQRTSAPGIFAAGNVLHGAETADTCAIEGRRVARAVTAWLVDGRWPERSVPIVPQSPIRWIAPNRVSADDRRATRRRMLLRVDSFPMASRVTVTQDQRVLWTGRPEGSMAPNRSIHLPDHWLRAVDPGGGPVVVALADLR